MVYWGVEFFVACARARRARRRRRREEKREASPVMVHFIRYCHPQQRSASESLQLRKSPDHHKTTDEVCEQKER